MYVCTYVCMHVPIHFSGDSVHWFRSIDDEMRKDHRNSKALSSSKLYKTHRLRNTEP